jgi:hypothetical protein
MRRLERFALCKRCLCARNPHRAIHTLMRLRRPKGYALDAKPADAAVRVLGTKSRTEAGRLAVMEIV